MLIAIIFPSFSHSTCGHAIIMVMFNRVHDTVTTNSEIERAGRQAQ